MATAADGRLRARRVLNFVFDADRLICEKPYFRRPTILRQLRVRADEAIE